MPVGGFDQLKPALRLMISYRLVLQNVVGVEVFTSYARWLESVEVKDTTASISLEDLRRVFGLESIKDAEGNVIHEAPLPVWANFQ
jgi:hypothetical protein